MEGWQFRHGRRKSAGVHRSKPAIFIFALNGARKLDYGERNINESILGTIMILENAQNFKSPRDVSAFGSRRFWRKKDALAGFQPTQRRLAAQHRRRSRHDDGGGRLACVRPMFLHRDGACGQLRSCGSAGRLCRSHRDRL